MSPKAASGEGSTGEGSAGTGATTSKVNEDMKLCWAMLCQMNKAGKLSGMDWNEIREQIGSNAIKTTQNRWYNLRDRMKDAGFELPTPQLKTAKTPTKRKEKNPAGDSNENLENPLTTPKKRKVKGENGAEGSAKKTTKKTAKQPKAEKETAAISASGSGPGGSDEEVVDDEVAETNGIHANIENEMKVA